MQRIVRRHRLLLIGLFLGAAILIGRLAYLQIFRYDFFTTKARSQLHKSITLHGKRGTIYDRKHRVLAMSETRYSAYVVPALIKHPYTAAVAIHRVTGLPTASVYVILTRKNRSFVWLKRSLPPNQYANLSQLAIKGVGFLPEQKRLYPNLSVGADVIGFVGTDQTGLSGIEYSFNHILSGGQRRVVIQGDPRGMPLITDLAHLRPIDNPLSTPYGQDLTLSIDLVIQHKAEQALQTAIDRFNAKGGQLIVLESQTGDVLAMVDLPSADPNHYSARLLKNACITDVFEPGSTFKIISLSAVLATSQVDPESVLTVPSTLPFHGKVIREAHTARSSIPATRTVSEIIEQSLNVGSTLLIEPVGKAAFHRMMKRFGIGDKTGVALPGESSGILHPFSKWSGTDIATLSFGHGVAVTSLQLITALNAIANDGQLILPRLVTHIQQTHGLTSKGFSPTIRRRVVDSHIAKQVREILHRSVDHGTGRSARIPHYSIAGKTGTAQKVNAAGTGYARGKYIASFFGFFPADQPRFSIYVMIDEPVGNIYGTTVAAPVFKQLGEDMLRYYHIPPDQWQSVRPKR